MDIISHYSAYTPARTSAVNQTASNQPTLKCVSADEFTELLKSWEGKPVDRSKFLYNGSETRAQLSDTEIAVLANKYDTHNMDQATYDRFLDDLESMGAISNIEKQQMGYHGINLVAYTGEDGKLVWCGLPNGTYARPDTLNDSDCLFAPWEADVDFSKWLTQRTQMELMGVAAPSNRTSAQDYENLLKGVLKIVGRMEARQEEDAEKAEKAGLVRQLADKNSDFYTNMRTALKAQVDKNKEDEEEQAIIDAMAAVLDAMSGKETVAGEKTSVNKSASDLTKKIGDRIARLRQKNPDDPEIAKLENMLKRLQEIGIYFDLSDTDDLWQSEDETFETLTQFLTRRQAEMSAHPIENEVNQEE